jgi:hypothetical protein
MTTAKEIRDVALDLLQGVAKAQNGLKYKDGFAVWTACSIVFEALALKFPPSRIRVDDEKTNEIVDALRRAVQSSVEIEERDSSGVKAASC